MRTASIILILTLLVGVLLARKQMQLLREQSCLEYPNLKAELTKFTKKQLENGSYLLDFIFTVKEKLPITLEASFSLMKCNLAGNPDSCEYYAKNLRFKNFCEKLSKKNEVWSPFIDSSEPSIHCPINPGTYQMSYVAERNDVFQFIPFPLGVWKLQSILFDGKKMVICVNTEIRVIERRKLQ